MRTFKQTVTLKDGTTQEVEVTLPDGVMTPEEIATGYKPVANFEAELSRRAESIVNERIEAKLSDEAFKTTALARWNIDPNPKLDGGGGGGDEDFTERLKTERERWDKEHKVPLVEENKGLKDRVSDLLGRMKGAVIVQAAAEAGVLPGLLKAGPNGTAPIVNMTGTFFGHDDEHDMFGVLEGDKFRFAPEVTTERPHMNASEYFAEWVKDEANKAFVGERRQGGPNVGGVDGDQAGEGGTITLTRAQASDNATYMAAQKKADESGGKVVVSKE